VTYFYAGSSSFPSGSGKTQLKWLDVFGTLYGHYWAIEISSTTVNGSTKS